MNPQTGDIVDVPEGEEPPDDYTVRIRVGQHLKLLGAAFEVVSVDPENNQLTLQAIPNSAPMKNRKTRRKEEAELKRALRDAGKALKGKGDG